MLSMSMDRIEGKANDIGSRLKDINKQLQRPLSQIDLKKAHQDVSRLIEEMYQLDDMVHEPSYENNCLMEYWTLNSLDDCVKNLKEISDLLEADISDPKAQSLLLTKLEEASYLWRDKYAKDFALWSEKVSGLVVEQPSYNSSYASPVFAKMPRNPTPYLTPSEAFEDGQALDHIDISRIDEPLMRPRL